MCVCVCVEGGWEGEGVDFFLQIHYGGVRGAGGGGGGGLEK
jgi:hypothetical protein